MAKETRYGRRLSMPYQCEHCKCWYNSSEHEGFTIYGLDEQVEGFLCIPCGETANAKAPPQKAIGLPSSLNRIEIIGPKGRETVRYIQSHETLKISIQDGEQTVKFFIQNTQCENNES